MRSDPKVTVLLAVHNGGSYLREAIRSIVSQEHGDFEFLIIDDASTDGSAEILDSCNDARIRRVRNNDNVGLTVSLNKGLSLARGEYVARMDSDDVSLPQRLSRQVEFLEAHPEVGLCGTWVEIIGETAGQVWKYPTEPDLIKCRLLFESPLAHPSVMMRKAALAKAGLSYDPRFRRAQDYDLWARAVRHFPIANVPEVLMRYRIHPRQAGVQSFDEQQQAAWLVRETQLLTLGICPSTGEAAIHQALSTGKGAATQDFVEGAGAWLWKIKNANDIARIYPEPVFTKDLANRWFNVCKETTALGMWTWRAFRKLPLSRYRDVRMKKRITFALKCGVRWNPRRS